MRGLSGLKPLFRAMMQRHPFWKAWGSPSWYFQLIRRRFTLRSDLDSSFRESYPAYVVFSCDLELDPPWNTGSWESRTSYGLEKGLPILIQLLEKYDIKATFFSEAVLAELRPDIIVALKRKGHEIGCHGYAHESYGGHYQLDPPAPSPKLLTVDEKKSKIFSAKEKLEDTVNSSIRSFRAPFLHVDNGTLSILDEAGFLIDSSLPNTLLGKLSKPYHPLKKNLFIEGEGNRRSDRMRKLVEIPVSVNMRPRLLPHSPYPLMHPQSLGATVNIKHIFTLSKLRHIPAIFLLIFHPWEFSHTRNPLDIMTGTEKTEWVEELLKCLLGLPETRFQTMFELYQLWETHYCPLHSSLRPNPANAEGGFLSAI
jgi:peptidoglycan/xylan/chitin deacetylase (PgdA/CDA1 family)